MHVARLIACEPDFTTGKRHFHEQAFAFSAASAFGSTAQALLKQIENFTPVRQDEIRKSASALLKLKQKRDVVAHGSMGYDGKDVSFLSFGASRKDFGGRYPYSSREIEGFCTRIVLHMSEIDRIITDYTRLSYEDCQKLTERWQRNQMAAAQKFVERHYHQETEPPSTPE